MAYKKTIVLTFVLVFIFTIIGIGGYFLYQKKDKEKQNQVLRDSCLVDSEVAKYEIKEKNRTLGDSEAEVLIYINNKETVAQKNIFQIDNIWTVYHPLEIHKCGVYIIRMFNYDPNKTKQDSGYKDELWKYDYTGKGEFLILLAEKPKEFISYFSPDFRVDSTESYIVLEKSYLGKDDYSFIIKDLKTKQDVFILPANEISRGNSNIVGSFNMREWTKDGKYFWGDIFDGADVLAFFRIERDTWKWKTFEAPAGTMGGTALNSEFGYITFDDGPTWTGDIEFSQMYKEQWLKEGKKVHFYLYNLFTKEKILIETTPEPLWSFKPQWISDTELQYEMPTGERKIYRIE